MRDKMVVIVFDEKFFESRVCIGLLLEELDSYEVMQELDVDKELVEFDVMLFCFFLEFKYCCIQQIKLRYEFEYEIDGVFMGDIGWQFDIIEVDIVFQRVL